MKKSFLFRQMGGLECVITGLMDEFSSFFKKFKYPREIFTFVVILVSFSVATMNVTPVSFPNCFKKIFNLIFNPFFFLFTGWYFLVSLIRHLFGGHFLIMFRFIRSDRCVVVLR